MPLSNLDRDGLIAFAEPFGKAIDRVGTVGGAWIRVDVQRAFQAAGVSLSKDHFYSVLPNLAGLPDYLWQGPRFLRGWSRVRFKEYQPLLMRVLGCLDELRNIPRDPGAGGFYWNNPMFPPLDAAVYYGLIRELKPSRILEVGSGFSTILALSALGANQSGSVACIEPYPRPELLDREKDLAALHRAPVQDVPDALFQQLEAGDILFIDTSHASKIGSDVHDLLFRVLPMIKPGVLVHIHDIFLPYEYPRAWFDDIGIVWNEQYVLLALLMDSTRYSVLLPNYLASVEQAPLLTEVFRDLNIGGLTMNMGGARGASIWMQVE